MRHPWLQAVAEGAGVAAAVWVVLRSKNRSVSGGLRWARGRGDGRPGVPQRRLSRRDVGGLDARWGHRPQHRSHPAVHASRADPAGGQGAFAAGCRLDGDGRGGNRRRLRVRARPRGDVRACRAGVPGRRRPRDPRRVLPWSPGPARSGACWACSWQSAQASAGSPWSGWYRSRSPAGRPRRSRSALRAGGTRQCGDVTLSGCCGSTARRSPPCWSSSRFPSPWPPAPVRRPRAVAA